MIFFDLFYTMIINQPLDSVYTHTQITTQQICASAHGKYAQFIAVMLLILLKIAKSLSMLPYKKYKWQIVRVHR